MNPAPLWASVSTAVGEVADALLFLSPLSLLGFAGAALVLAKLERYRRSQCPAAENLNSFIYFFSKH